MSRCTIVRGQGNAGLDTREVLGGGRRAAAATLVARIAAGGILVGGLLAATGCAARQGPAGRGTASINPRASVAPVLASGVRAPALLDQLIATRNLSRGRPTAVTPVPGAVLFLRSGPREREQALFEVDAQSGQERRVIDAATLLGAGGAPGASAGPGSDFEQAALERQRISARGITGFSVSRDGATILVPLAGRAFVLDRATAAAREIVGPGGPIEAAVLSPDGSRVALVRAGDVYLWDRADARQRRLTFSASETVTNGLPEFIAQEELGRQEGLWWSPAADALLVQQTDVSALERFTIADPADPAQPPDVFPYPRARTGVDAAVRLRLIRLSERGGESLGGEAGAVSIAWDRANYPTLARVQWPSDGVPTILVQDRAQREQVLLAIDVGPGPAAGGTRRLLIERDPAWLNLAPGLEDGPIWVGDEGFVWMREDAQADGWVIALHAPDGTPIRDLTTAPEGVRRVVGVADGWVYYEASSDPMQRRAFRVPTAGGEAERVAVGQGDLAAGDPAVEGLLMPRAGAGPIVLVRSTPTAATRWIVLPVGTDASASGDTLEIVSVAESPSIEPRAERAVVGERSWSALVVRPTWWREGQVLPVVLWIYGGPSDPGVTASREGLLPMQWLAEQGFIVVEIDNRGTSGRGRAWERAWKQAGDFFTPILEDQVAALRALATDRPEMDLTRVGAWGWSFGGYSAAMLAMQRPDAIHAAVAGAPVADWGDYDTHYTYRYLGTPEANPEGYRRSSLLTHAADLRVPLLIIHGTADDNVYTTHAYRLADALLRAGVGFEFLPLPGVTHMIVDPAMDRAVRLRVAEFFARTLRAPTGTPPDPASPGQPPASQPSSAGPVPQGSGLSG